MQGVGGLDRPRLNNLRSIRVARGMAQRDLCVAAAVSPSFLYLLESGRRGAPPAIARRLADALGVEPEELEGRQTVAQSMPGLRRLREARGLSEPDLAERAGVGPRTVLLIESGRQRASQRTLAKLATALGVDPDELVRGPART